MVLQRLYHASAILVNETARKKERGQEEKKIKPGRL
jgi:hypothetical protein